MQRVVVLTAAALLLTLSHVAVAFVALLALLKPSLPLLVGAGLAALTAAGLAVRDHGGTAYVADDVAAAGRDRARAARLCVGPSS